MLRFPSSKELVLAANGFHQVHGKLSSTSSQNNFRVCPTTTWEGGMAKVQVMDETGHRVDVDTAFRAGACIFYYRELENEKTIPFREQVLYQG
jgi:hypothetical protein